MPFSATDMYAAFFFFYLGCIEHIITWPNFGRQKTITYQIIFVHVALLLKCKVPILGPIIMLEMHNLSTENCYPEIT